MVQAQESLLDLNAEQLRELAAALITRINEQSQQHAVAIAAKDSDIQYRQTKIDKLTHELATLKRWKFGRSSELLNAAQISLLDETLDADIAAIEEELKELSPTVTANKRLNHISQYIQFFREVFIDPNTRSSNVRQQLDVEYDKISSQLRKAIGGTKQGHHHDIRSVPTDKFLGIIEAVFTRPAELFLSESGKPSRTVLRDRAMVLLACEGLRPGTLGNISIADFRPNSGHLVITDNRSKRSERITSGTPKLKMGASTLVSNASETMIQIWPFTSRAIQEYVDCERTTVLMKRMRNKSEGFLFLNEKGESIKHRSSITGLFNRLGQQLEVLGLLDIGNDPYFTNQKTYDFYGYVLRHSAATFYLSEKGTEERVKDQMKVRFGWTLTSNMPERYAARAISDQANVDLKEFNQRLLNATKGMNQKVLAQDDL